MAITYIEKTEGLFAGLKLPKLHTVVYAKTVDNVIATYQRSHKDYLVDEWLKQNCKSRYYHSPGYERIKYIQFEDDEEATLFALRWA